MAINPETGIDEPTNGGETEEGLEILPS